MNADHSSPDESPRENPEKKARKEIKPEGPDPVRPPPEEDPEHIDDPRLPGNEPH